MDIDKTIKIAGNTKHPLVVNRPGYGTMRLTGEGIYGEPPRRQEALDILKHAVHHGVNFLDTADYYGEDVTNRLIAEALYPYTDDLVICTKVGATRRPDKSWVAFFAPANLRTAIDNNRRTLKLDRIALVHYRVIGGDADSFKRGIETMLEMQHEGKILHFGVSNVTPGELETAMSMGNIATVENMYGHGQRTTLKTPHGENRGGGELLHICEENEIPLIPYFSLLNSLDKKDPRIKTVAEKYGATEAQTDIAWLMHKSKWILPIPGTSRLAHLVENLGAAALGLTAEDMAFLE
jgi:pyridoxine 4-dehydrogenase